MENVNKGSAFFDVTKLNHINGEYIRALPVETFIEMAEPFVYGVDTEISWDKGDYDPEVFAMVAPDVQQRVDTFAEIPKFISWLFAKDVEFDVESKGFKKAIIKGKMIPEILDAMAERFTSVEWTAEAMNAEVSAIGDELGARSQVPARVAITGTNAGIPLWDAAATLDRQVVLDRIAKLRELV